MTSLEEKEKLRSLVYRDASLKRVFGMIKAFLIGKKGCTMNWIYGQITKAHNLDEARIVFSAFEDELVAINREKLNQLQSRLSI